MLSIEKVILLPTNDGRPPSSTLIYIRKLVARGYSRYLRSHNNYKTVEESVIGYLHSLDVSPTTRCTYCIVLCNMIKIVHPQFDDKTVRKIFHHKIADVWSHKSGNWEEYWSITQHLLQAKRMLALRDGIVLGILLTTGMRASEVASVVRKDRNIIVAKIGKKRTGDYYAQYRIDDTIANAMDRYERYRDKSYPQFLQSKYGVPIDRTVVYRIVKKHLGTYPHTLRHTVGTRVTKQLGIEIASALLNHSSFDITKKYVDKSELLHNIDVINCTR